jgi:hypothetical protein
MLFWLLVSALAAAAPEQASLYIEGNAVQSARTLESICAKDFKSLAAEAEQLEWVKARLAWISLERLRGQEAEALKIFAGCGNYCEKHAPEREWRSLKAWACGKKKEAIPCLSKTKAQKPSH